MYTSITAFGLFVFSFRHSSLQVGIMLYPIFFTFSIMSGIYNAQSTVNESMKMSVNKLWPTPFVRPMLG